MYTEMLSSLPGIGFQKVHPADTNTYKDYSIHVTREVFGMTRDALAQSLRAENIETKKYFYPPLHQQTLYSKFHEPERNDLRQTEYVADGILSLPIYESLPDETVRGVAEALKRIAHFASDRKDTRMGGSQSRVAARQ
jgi:dTDP-4-amino-4,6-dideoxygalactose transaminase